jgi:acetyl-CoA carboxylase biotin carboxylase subunit
VGFPCPKTFLPEKADDLTKIAKEIGFPLIVKRRFTAGGRGMFLVNNLAELLDKVKLADANRGSILIQEYIPSDINDNIAITLDKNGD